MPEYKAPGVYVEEVERGPKAIEGVSTSVAGFVGVTERGPLEPTLVTSFADFRRTFGGYATDEDWSNLSYETSLPYAVEGYFANGGSRAYVTRVVPKAWVDNEFAASTTLADGSGNNATDAVTVTAVGPGYWGDNVVVEVGPASSGDSERFKLRIGYWRNGGTFSTGNGYDGIVDSKGRPTHEEVYDELSADKADTNYYETMVSGVSSLVTLAPANDGVKPQEATTVLSISGSHNSNTSANDYTGQTYSDRAGLATFETVDEITMVSVPDESQHDVSGDVVTHCVDRKDRIALLSVRSEPSTSSGLDSGIVSEYAALYYPWVRIRDPLTGLQRAIPPTGHVAGIYARSDAEHGVHKAPANEQVRGIDGLDRTVTKGEQESLNPMGVNCIRSFRGRGIRVWGARTTSSDPSWKYVNVRRLFMYVEESIDEGTQWVVFEPNDEELWARVRQTISNFLTGLWEDGALMGSTPEEAFFVTCDRTTMTQNDIDNGRLICEIGIAPVKPAEFVVFRIAQWTGGAEGGG